MRTALIHVIPADGGGYEARLTLDWDGKAYPGPDAPRASFSAIPPPPDGYTDWIAFLLKTSGPSPEFGNLGVKLHDLLMASPIGQELRRARALGQMRLLIRMEPPELDALPWELMRNGTMTMFTNASMPVARVAPYFNPALELPPMCWPLRVMLVVATKDADRTIKVEEEVQYIKDAFRRVCGLVDLELCLLPDREGIRKLAEAMQPNVFHFIGHGGEDDGGGFLRLEQKGEGTSDHPWTADEIRDDLAFAVKDNHNSPDQTSRVLRLAVLNACQSGLPAEHRGTLAAAQGLAELNVPAVIAMQGPIRGTAAARFAKGLYETLSTGGPLDRAVTRARVEITDKFPKNQREYALPALILGAPPERILDLSHCDPNLRLPAAPREQVLSFVDRVRRRRQLWDGLWTDRQTGPRIFAITGPVKAGKGSLVRWCLGVASVLGYRAVFADIEGGGEQVGPTGFLDELIAAAEGDAEFYAVSADMRTALAKYKYDHVQARNEGRAFAENPVPLYDKLTSALATVAAERPLLIGIDGLAAVEPGTWEFHAIPGLVRPIARGTAGQVRLVVSLQPGELKARFPQRHFERAQIAEIPIKLFPSADFVELATQKLRALGYTHESFGTFVRGQQEDITQDWGTDYFDLVDSKASAAQWEREWQP